MGQKGLKNRIEGAEGAEEWDGSEREAGPVQKYLTSLRKEKGDRKMSVFFIRFGVEMKGSDETLVRGKVLR